MTIRFTIRKSATVALLALAPILLSLTACISIYDNTSRFQATPPREGMSEVELLQKCGAPDFAGFVEDQKVYVYKVRDSKFIIAVGQFAGYDLVVTCKGGAVKNVQQVSRGQTTCIFTPAPWIGMD